MSVWFFLILFFSYLKRWNDYSQGHAKLQSYRHILIFVCSSWCNYLTFLMGKNVLILMGKNVGGWSLQRPEGLWVSSTLCVISFPSSTTANSGKSTGDILAYQCTLALWKLTRARRAYTTFLFKLVFYGADHMLTPMEQWVLSEFPITQGWKTASHCFKLLCLGVGWLIATDHWNRDSKPSDIF